MKIGFICPNIPGHINPMTALARHLQERNHEVVFLYSPSAHGLPCVPGDKNRDMSANRPEMSKLEGVGAIEFYCGLAAKETEVIFKSLPKMVETTRVEALILDPVQFFVMMERVDPKWIFPWDRLTGEPLIYASMGTLM